jgi:starch-binding outer membrane protein, SusD/RagB family
MIRKRFALWLCLFTMCINAWSCKKYLDQVPDDRITIEEVFQKKQASEQYLANVYSYIMDSEGNQWDANPWTTTCDEIQDSWTSHACTKINLGVISSGNVPFAKWAHYYKGIRSASYFVNHIDGNKEILALNGQKLIDQYKAEARCLRAWFYFCLLRQYGPVVLLGDKEVNVNATDIQFPRNSFDECVAFVSGELDAAAAILPNVPSRNGQESDLEYGRMTKPIALAIKSRLLLYAASPLYNGNTDYAGYTNTDGKVLISQTYSQAKWEAAAKAALAVIQTGLFNLYKAPGGDPVTSYRNILLESWNVETIFARPANNLWDWENHCNLRSAGGWNGMSPTQEMVDAYFMSDGKTIKESSLYDETGFTNGVYNMYQNREPRFYASVTYNRSEWQGGALTTPITVDLSYSGRDGKKDGKEDYSHTGYLARKNLHPGSNRLTNSFVSRPFVMIRLGEIYLNYAEALNEYDPGNADIVKYLNLIRERAGIPQYGSPGLPVPAGKDAMREKIKAERRIELAFETHRWFDIRRWKILEQTVNGPLHGMNVDGDGDAFYKRTVITNRVYRKAYNWFPVEQYELDRARLVVQAPYW